MVGLDIGAHSIKAVELQKREGSFALVNFGTKDRAPQESLSDAVKKFLSETTFNSKELNISVSGQLVLARVFELPDMKTEELKGAVRFEVERFIPFNIDEAVLDYQIVSRNPEAKKANILAAAAKRDFVKNYIDIISGAGFTVKAVDVAGVALTNAFLNARPQYEKEGDQSPPFALLNVDSALLNMCIVYKGLPFVLRDIASAELDTDMIEREADLSFGYFENQFAKGVETIYLSGKLSGFAGLKEALSGALDVKVDLWDPFASIVVEKETLSKPLEDVRQELAVAVGLAIRDD